MVAMEGTVEMARKVKQAGKAHTVIQAQEEAKEKLARQVLQVLQDQGANLEKTAKKTAMMATKVVETGDFID